MTEPENPTLDSNMSDFDNSDGDLASLLGDDDDDVFAKKKHDSPSKTLSIAASTPAVKKTIDHPKLASPQKSVETKPIKDQDDDNFSDILDDLIDSNSENFSNKKLAPTENKSKQSYLFNKAGDTDKTNSSYFSPAKLSTENPSSTATTSTLRGKNIKKQSISMDDFNSPNKGTSKPSERRSSFFDDFLQKLSPKHEEKKSAVTVSNKNLEENEEEDILSAYVPTAPKKNEEADNTSIKSPQRKGSLLKQVSFKNIPDDFTEKDLDTSKTVTSPLNENKRRQSFTGQQNDNVSSQTKRIEKMGGNKKDDIDWLNFFKESPKKSKAPETSKQKDISDVEKTSVLTTDKPKSNLRRQSSASWLGLNDTKDESNSVIKPDQKNDSILSNFAETRPKTTEGSFNRRSRRQDFNKKNDDDWIVDRSNSMLSNQSSVDLSDILKTAQTNLPEKKSKTPLFSTKVTTELENNFLESSNSNFTTTPTVTEIQRNPSIASKGLRNETAPLRDLQMHTTLPVSVPIKDKVATLPAAALTSLPPMTNINAISVKEINPQDVTQSFELTATIHSLQQQLNDSMQERNRLMKEIESLKYMYEEKIKTVEELHKNEKKSIEDSYKNAEMRLKNDFELKIKAVEDRLQMLAQEKSNQENILKEKLENIRKDHEVEIQRLKDLHNHSISIMKEDHEDALSRLKRLKEQELEAVLSSQVHSKSLQHLSDELEARAKELSSLQAKVEERNQITLREKQALLDAKEKDLKTLQNRLQRQLDETDEERTRLQQLVLRLENRLQKMTMEGEEDRWEVNQMKAKLAVQQKYLEEEQKLNQYQFEKEKEKLRISQDSLLHEQKTVLLQLAQERQQLTQEKVDIQSLSKSIKEEEAKFNVKKLKEESNIESEKQFLMEEKNKLHFEKEKVKQEFYQLERERDSLQREKQHLQREKEAVHELEMNLKRKASELEELAAATTQQEEKSRREHAIALSIKTEHQMKMQQYAQQMQMLMDKERQILSEREKLMAEKMEFEQNKSTVLCTKCKLSVEKPFQAPPVEYNLPVIVPVPNINGMSNQVQQSFIDPNLVIWQITAQKDREFLQEELSFLKSLKESNKRKDHK